MATQTTDTTEVAQSRLVAELGHMDNVAYAEPFLDGAQAKLDGHFGPGQITQIQRLGHRVDGVSLISRTVYFAPES